MDRYLPLTTAVFVAACAVGSPTSATVVVAPIADVPTPAQIIERVLAAQQPAGFKDRAGYCGSGHGTYYMANGPMVFSMASCVIGIDRARVETFAPEQFKSVYVDDGTAAWEVTASGVKPVSAEERASMRAEAYVDWITALWPLHGPGYRFTALAPSDVRGVSTLGIRVSRDGELDVDFYVDPKTWRVMKKAYHGKFQGRTVYNETFYSEWTMADGVNYPSHAESFRDGKPKSEWVFDLHFPEVMDETQFRRPDGAPPQ